MVQSLDDDQIGRLVRMMAELCRLVDDGAIPYGAVIERLDQLRRANFELYPVTVGGLEVPALDLLERTGYAHIDHSFVMRNPSVGGAAERRVDVELVEVASTMFSTDEALAALTARALEPPTVEVAIRFACTYPEAQGRSPIVFAVQGLFMADGRPRTIVLSGSDERRRRLRLFPSDLGWRPQFLFAGVRYL